ncbi:hypothetical protein [Streptomyces sp. NPDC057494]|uniref:hypothetical protein n=1 Tax=Streptomyces sp. NPDC057494 TaxID=3346148 RepID=UPI00367B27A9
MPHREMSVLLQTDGAYAKTKPTYMPLEPGHHYIVDTVPDPAYGDGWVWFATAADNDLTTGALARRALRDL